MTSMTDIPAGTALSAAPSTRSPDPDSPKVAEIHTAPASRMPMRSLTQVSAEAGKGLVGDRYHGTRHRHVTVQSRTDLDDAAADLGGPVPSWGTRRNLTISHGPIHTRPGTRLRIGTVELEVVRLAAPCRLLEDTLGPGAMRALRRRGGAVCRLLTSGTISIGDVVHWYESAADPREDASGRGA